MGISKHLMFDLEDAEDELEAALDTPDGARIAAARAAVELAEARRSRAFDSAYARARVHFRLSTSQWPIITITL